MSSLAQSPPNRLVVGPLDGDQLAEDVVNYGANSSLQIPFEPPSAPFKLGLRIDIPQTQPHRITLATFGQGDSATIVIPPNANLEALDVVVSLELLENGELMIWDHSNDKTARVGGNSTIKFPETGRRWVLIDPYVNPCFAFGQDAAYRFRIIWQRQSPFASADMCNPFIPVKPLYLDTKPWKELVYLDRGSLGRRCNFGAREVVNAHTGEHLVRRDVSTKHLPLDEIIKEIKLLEGIRHPNIARFVTAQQRGEWVEIFTEIKSGAVEKSSSEIYFPRNQTEQVSFCRQMLEVFHFLDGQGMLYRRIKPRYILFEDLPGGDRRYYLFDFGRSRFMLSDETRNHSKVYWAPEGPENRFPKPDLWDLGILILWESKARKKRDVEITAGQFIEEASRHKFPWLKSMIASKKDQLSAGELLQKYFSGGDSTSADPLIASVRDDAESSKAGQKAEEETGIMTRSKRLRILEDEKDDPPRKQQMLEKASAKNP